MMMMMMKPVTVLWFLGCGSVKTSSGAHPASYSMGAEDFCPGVQQQWCEANQTSS